MAPTIAGTNVITQTEDAVVTTLAVLESFQAFVSAPTEAAAREHVFVSVFDEFSTDDDLDSKSPYVLIYHPEDSPQAVWTKYADGAPFLFNCDHVLAVRFVKPMPSDRKGKFQDVMRQWKNDVGTIMEDFIEQAGLDDRFGSTLVQTEPPGWIKEGKKPNKLVWEWTVARQINANQ